MKASEKMKQMRVTLAPISFLLSVGLTFIAIVLVAQLIEIGRNPIQWIEEDHSKRLILAAALAVEFFFAVAGVIALNRIRPEKPSQLFHMGIDSAGFILIDRIIDFIALSILFVPPFLILFLADFIWEVVFAFGILLVFAALLVYLRIRGARFHADRFFSKIAAPILSISTPIVGAASKFWDDALADLIAPYIDDVIDAIPRLATIGA